jgi:hypothetical protein
VFRLNQVSDREGRDGLDDRLPDMVEIPLPDLGIKEWSRPGTSSGRVEGLEPALLLGGLPDGFEQGVDSRGVCVAASYLAPLPNIHQAIEERPNSNVLGRKATSSLRLTVAHRLVVGHRFPALCSISYKPSGASWQPYG